MNVNAMNTDIVANDLTQLSSREQLSALMDGALPPDQTRFLLRRLQHDAPLADCWERWRLSGEVMRGLAPAQRLPSDFALRVGAALRGEDATAAQATNRRRPAAWLRWGGGAAVAASLAVVALLARQPAPDAPAASMQSMQVASTSTPAPETAPAPDSTTQAPTPAGTAAQAIAATVVAVAARPQRETRGKSERAVTRATPLVRDDAAAAPASQVAAIEPAMQVPQPDIVTRPWPRSVLPQYASGGLTVGFGEHGTGAMSYNPFEARASFGNPPAAAQADEDAAREPQP